MNTRNANRRNKSPLRSHWTLARGRTGWHLLTLDQVDRLAATALGLRQDDRESLSAFAYTSREEARAAAKQFHEFDQSGE